MKIFQVAFALTVSSFFLSGCVSEKESMIKQGYPLAYADGFDDGCHSGRKAGGNIFENFRKDVRRFEADSQYRQAWGDGFRQCESEQEAIQRNMRISIEQQKLNEQRKQNDYSRKYHLEGVDTSNWKYLK